MKNNLRDLYLQQLQNLLSAETQALDFLRGASMKATDQDLKEVLSAHLSETKCQIEKLEELLKSHPSVDAHGGECHATKGLLANARLALSEKGDPMVLDAQLIIAARGIESYEISAYTSAILMAEALNESDEAKELRTILKEEEGAAKKLNRISEGGFFSKGLVERIVK